jgi:hypothetical protein
MAIGVVTQDGYLSTCPLYPDGNALDGLLFDGMGEEVGDPINGQCKNKATLAPLVGTEPPESIFLMTLTHFWSHQTLRGLSRRSIAEAGPSLRRHMSCFLVLCSDAGLCLLWEQ